jgi:hypothetical protein
LNRLALGWQPNAVEIFARGIDTDKDPLAAALPKVM